ncbi:hypothetical protein H109_05351 [Trichophyton interdigitale MR816]|uniref:Uncharacterized protein n=1 Tax=Trichophyton interdigitale (strain MR816) TaxID=1215338 RepID=A0A059J4N0_TRIIM|nr:hypothetical protein H101_02234 [Trichophyton interdigitale H6]KDB22729.1 hypothetical protein H109_05351 [Trichophyton interdigitale MR816]
MTIASVPTGARTTLLNVDIRTSGLVSRRLLTMGLSVAVDHASLQCSAKTTNASAHLTHAETIARSAKLLSNAFMANALVHLVLVEMTAKSARHPSSARMANVFVLRTPVVMTVKNAKPLSNASMDSVLAQ